MKKNVDIPILDLDGDAIREMHKGRERQCTVRTYAVNALALGNGHESTGEDKITRYRLAMRLHEGGECELSAEECALIKSAVGALYPPLIVGQIHQWADE